MAGLVLALVLLQTADAGSRVGDGGLPPHGLACLPSWYSGTPQWQPEAGWGLELVDGGFIAWRSQAVADAGLDGGSDPDSEQAPDLEDVFATPYVPGPIVPIDTSDAGKIDDPGRVRVSQLFLATYGATRNEVQAHLALVSFFGMRWPFHERAAPALARVVERLKVQLKTNPRLLPFLTDIGGTWIWRRIARSKNLSAHAWGIAIDINVERSAYWRWTYRGQPLKWQNRIPQEIVDAFEAEGFIWGGRWVHYDTMHFEYRPELLSANCKD